MIHDLNQMLFSAASGNSPKRSSPANNEGLEETNRKQKQFSTKGQGIVLQKSTKDLKQYKARVKRDTLSISAKANPSTLRYLSSLNLQQQVENGNFAIKIGANNPMNAAAPPDSGLFLSK